MNLKKAKAIRKLLFKLGVVRRETLQLKNGQLYNAYRRKKNELIRSMSK